MALDRNGNVYSWGGNDFGVFGSFEKKIQPYAKKIDSLSSITNKCLGWHHSVALNEKGKVFIWGSDPSTQNKESTGKFLKEITQLQALPIKDQKNCMRNQSWHSLAIDENDEVWGWGKNHFGMLGTGDISSYSIPQKLPLPKGICNIGGGCFQTLQ